jgi:hypothetical protein
MDRPLQSAAEAVAVVCIGLGAASCGGGGSSVPTSVDQAPVIASFTLSPSWMTTGQTATLKWSVSGATSLTVDPIGAVTGTSTQVTATADTNYVLTATNQYGSTQAQATLAVFAPPRTWFAPFPPNLWPNYGSVDYVDLFSPSAPWSMAASHIQVFKLYPYTLSLPDSDLKNLFADLKRRHIAVGLEQGGLMPTGSGTCPGDFDGVNALGYAQHIRDLGGSLQYVMLDEPFYSAVVDDQVGACHWTVQQTVDNVSLTVAAMRSVFPDLVVGDIEVVGNGASNDTVLSLYQQWVDAWKSTNGTPFAFFYYDLAWTAHWQPSVAALSHALRYRYIPVGQIYIGDGTTDAGWVAQAEQWMTDYEIHGSPLPDQVIFQSWDALPDHVLPESDPASFTYLIDRYFRNRTQLTLAVNGSVVTGTLTAPSGPLANAAIALTGAPLSGTGQTSAFTYTGTVPTGTQYVIFGARVGLEECSTYPLPAEFYLTDFTLDAGVAGVLHDDFASGLTGWGIWGDAAIAQVEQNNLHVQVLSGQTLGLNSVSLPFAAAGAAYSLTVNATVPLGSRGEGCAIAVFQDAKFAEVGRASLQIVPQRVSLGTAQTDAGGRYALGLAPQATTYELWADYAGAATMWPASAWKLIGQAPALAIATTSLADGTVGSPYAQSLTASGGLTPYLWVGGEPPPGLVLGQDGALSGTPTAAGTYTVVMSVVDDSAPTQVVDASFPLVIH